MSTKATQTRTRSVRHLSAGPARRLTPYHGGISRKIGRRVVRGLASISPHSAAIPMMATIVITFAIMVAIVVLASQGHGIRLA